MKKLIYVLTLFFILLMSFNANAQDIIKSKDLSTVKVDYLSDDEIGRIVSQLKSNSATIDDVESMALSKGMSQNEFDKLRTRVKEYEKKNSSDKDKKDKNKKDKDKKDKDKKDPNKDQENKDKDKGDKDKKDQDNNKDKDKKNQQNEPKPQPDQLSKEDAERMLEALNNEEKNTQDKLKNKKAKGVKGKIVKDW